MGEQSSVGDFGGEAELCRSSWWNSLEGSGILSEILREEQNLGGAPGGKAETWWSS